MSSSDMTDLLDAVAKVLLWCVVFGFLLLLLWAAVFVLAGDCNMHARPQPHRTACQTPPAASDIDHWTLYHFT